MKIKVILASAILAASATLPLMAITVGPSDIIPKPTSVIETKSVFHIPADGFTYSIKGDSEGGLANYLALQPELFKTATNASKANLQIEITNGTGENYEMEITPRKIKVKTPTATGAFYAVQSLIQMCSINNATDLACCKIVDTPRFAYRGLHFDVSRHFRTPDFLKKQIDAMALMKLNNLHLHFTDAAGWRMEIEKYPRLTEFAAWRPQAKWQDWVDNGARYCEQSDSRASGGFYTKNELRDLIKYAADRHITVIPEIEIPGHSKEVTSAYPEFSCSGKPYTDEDLCIGKEATFKFIEDVLDEVIEVFPSAYIHIGGDEASKSGWRNCADCQARMKAEGLKDVDELQSYAIERVEKYLNSKGRDIIGWDEILEGGLAPNATVMSWRGTEGGIKALKSGHNVIMTPGEFCYIDYTQDAAFKEPVSIGGYIPLSKVYSYEPVQPELSADEARHLLGVQANLWSEYVPTDEHAEYMYYPRAYAIAEIGWSAPGKDYPDFHRRALMLNEHLDSAGYTTFNLKNEFGERRESLTPVNHIAKGAKVTYATPYHSKYPAAGAETLVDGLRGGWTYGDKRWQGFLGDFEATVDLGEERDLHWINATFMHAPGAWVHLPDSVTIETSADGKQFTPVETIWSDVDPMYPKIMMRNFGTSTTGKARYIKVKAKGNSRPGAWLFIDEIEVN
ncbi:MAG: family 20 glycosylhydrolase [Firmicutes bacterium]|nr:family 20 glycosylhydrolase [Bacillota bacterium]MCM1401274.1 family 20 glycosylhydrolase [Bacteroides sp.]